ncbi:hypothetical protein R3P38DRAFT_3228414 [Favolaschia claudopus]|uniref:3'-5' exonuclease n=1 Tax=Favolaschia claudopus TaxID=2862362 RepID=A0AAV9ZQM6_9AGAR
MLFEMHTHRYNTLMLQYLEAVFERERERDLRVGSPGTSTQATLHNISTMNTVPAFGDFADPQRYTGFVPSVSYLTAMLNKAIERDESDADQHTSCLAPDQADLDDSFKVFCDLISPRVCFVGSSIQGDFTRLKKQFTQLENQTINVIDLKQFAIQRALIEKKDSGSLESLAAKFLGVFLSKDRSLRTGEHWEQSVIAPDLLNYAALDVYASRLIFDELSKTAALQRVQHDTPPGTRVALLTREGGAIAAYGQISHVQTSTDAGVRITKSRVLVDSDSVVIPSAAAILHFAPTNTSAQTKTKSTKSDTLTLSHLRSLSNSPDSSFHLVSPVSLLQFDQREPSERQAAPASSSAVPLDPALFHHTASSDLDPNEEEQEEDMDDKLLENEDQAEERLRTQMLEAHAEAGSDNHFEDEFDTSPLGKGLWNMLNKIMTSPEDAEQCYTRIKKDIFHAFHMIPLPSSHGLRAVFLQTFRDHMMRWDPAIRARVDEKCRQIFKIGFDVMSIRNPRWIKKRTPRYVPPPSVLVPAIEHVFNIFGNALDAKSGQPLFNALAQQKAKAVLDLAREGYLSDPAGVVLYEKVGVDKHGLELFSCRRGTNKLEGGPHSDIYRKFGAFHAAPRLTVNSLTDHRTYYNLQAMAKHEFGVNWEYHHDLALINCTSFLLNYLADIVPGIESYADWLNPDLYERTTEKFGICEVPESYAAFSCWNRVFSKPTVNGPYDENAVERFKLNGNNDWLRRRQGVALPIVPPTTPEARKYYFANVGDFVVEASISGRRKISHESFANRWNSTADGKTRFYVSADLLAAFAKSWEKTNNARASQELISAKVDLAHQTRQLFQETNNLPFPNSLLGTATSSHPQEGLIEFEAGNPVPDSISTDLAISRPQIQSIAPSRQKLRTSSKEKSSANSVPTASQASHRISISPSRSTEVRTLIQSSSESSTAPGPSANSARYNLVTPNTIAVEISGEEAWEQAHAAAARANCFIRLAHSPAIRVKASMIPPKRSAGGVRVDAAQEVQVAVALGDHNFPDLAHFVAGVRVRDKGVTPMEMMNSTPVPRPVTVCLWRQACR